MTSELSKDTLAQVYNDYIEAFSNGEFEALTANFSLPAMLVQPNGTMEIANNELLIAVMQKLYSSLPENFAKTSLVDLTYTEINDNCAAAHIFYDRISDSGDTISKEQGVYYFFNKVDGWKIGSVVLMPPLD